MVCLVRPVAEEEFSHPHEIGHCQVLGEYVCALLLRVYVHKAHGFVQGKRAHVMLLQFHVLVPSCNHSVRGHVDTGLVVLEDRRRFGLWETELLKCIP